VIGPSQRQYTTLTTENYASYGIRTRNLSKRAAADPRLRSRGARLIVTSYNFTIIDLILIKYEGWNFNSGNYLFTTDTK